MKTIFFFTKAESLTITDFDFSGKDDYDLEIRGVKCINCRNITFTDGHFNKMHADWGAGVQLDNELSTEYQTVDFNNVKFQNSYGFGGAGLFATGMVKINLTNCSMEYNSVTRSGESTDAATAPAGND